MDVQLYKPNQSIAGSIQLPGSKSISNRVLIIKALSGLNFNIDNISDSDDTNHLKQALDNFSNTTIMDVGHAGTDMRFLTAFLALQKGSYELTGSARLQQRPIKDLVDVLKILGADITYKNQEGYPPLLINGRPLSGGKVEISGKVSSQFITALLLIAPYLTKGLEINIKDELVSVPYVNMTIETMKEFGANVVWTNDIIKVLPGAYSYAKDNYFVESDWSAASYYYSIVALSKPDTELTINFLFENGLQADSVCKTIYESFGVQTRYQNNQIIISKTINTINQSFNYDFVNCPDIAQTLVCTCIGLQIPFLFTGLQTLKVKETDRIIALQTECKKIGIELIVTENSIQWNGIGDLNVTQLASIATYNDHRMAMSFAPLSLLINNLMIENAEVVSKSYPLFWEHLKQIGFFNR